MAVTTFSPSNSSSTRSTPCVDGCCGPMFRTIVLVVPIAVSTVVIGYNPRFGFELTLSFHRKITAQRRSFEAVRQKNTSQIRMPFKTNAEEIKNLALQPVGARPNRNQGIDHRLLRADAGAQPNPVPAGQRNQVI